VPRNPAVPESNEVLKKDKNKNNGGVCQRDIGANWKRSQWPNLEQFEQQNKTLL